MLISFANACFRIYALIGSDIKAVQAVRLYDEARSQTILSFPRRWPPTQLDGDGEKLLHWLPDEELWLMPVGVTHLDRGDGERALAWYGRLKRAVMDVTVMASGSVVASSPTFAWTALAARHMATSLSATPVCAIRTYSRCNSLLHAARVV